jgi:hypothetical protein
VGGDGVGGDGVGGDGVGGDGVGDSEGTGVGLLVGDSEGTGVGLKLCVMVGEAVMIAKKLESEESGEDFRASSRSVLKLPSVAPPTPSPSNNVSEPAGRAMVSRAVYSHSSSAGDNPSHTTSSLLSPSTSATAAAIALLVSRFPLPFGTSLVNTIPTSIWTEACRYRWWLVGDSVGALVGDSTGESDGNATGACVIGEDGLFVVGAPVTPSDARRRLFEIVMFCISEVFGKVAGNELAVAVIEAFFGAA